jgi:hypothetical protein
MFQSVVVPQRHASSIADFLRVDGRVVKQVHGAFKKAHVSMMTHKGARLKVCEQKVADFFSARCISCGIFVNEFLLPV